jgi:nicotinate-nucleotide pyrophosphorylase (carboxylating)
MDIQTMKAAVELAAGRVLLEASGGIAEGTLRAVAETGVDIISLGALTHSVKALDISMKIK